MHFAPQISQRVAEASDVHPSTHGKDKANHSMDLTCHVI